MKVDLQDWFPASGAAGPRSCLTSNRVICSDYLKKANRGRPTRSPTSEEEFGVSYHPEHVSRLLRHKYGMSYAIPRPETPSRPDNAEEILAERLVQALGEIDADRQKEAADHGETILGFFR